jgi:hypothetical protein
MPTTVAGAFAAAGLGYEGLARRKNAMLVVDFATVGYSSDAYEPRLIVNNIHNAPVADADSPLILIAFQLFASSRPWVIRKRF